MEINIETNCPFTHNESCMAKGIIEQNGVAHLSCSSKHQFIVLIENPMYQIDMIRSYQAYSSGFYLEAFTSLYQALEDFRKSFIEISLLKLDKSSSSDYIRRVQALLNGSLNNSTSLYGAYKLMYFELMNKEVDNNDSDFNLHSKNFHLVPFRNKVIHRGVWPKKDDVLKCGNILVHYFSGIESEISKKLAFFHAGLTFDKDANVRNMSMWEFYRRQISSFSLRELKDHYKDNSVFSVHDESINFANHLFGENGELVSSNNTDYQKLAKQWKTKNSQYDTLRINLFQ